MVEQGVIHANPLDKIKFSKKAPLKRARVILSPDEIKDMLEKMQEHSGDIVYPIIFVITHTGARREEIRTLKWCDVDFENGFIILRKTKNGKGRRVKMAPQVREFLMRQPHRNEYVFTGPDELLPSKATIEYHVIRLQQLNQGMKPWRVHDLRHSFAHNYLKSGGEMYEPKANLGHKSIQMTMVLHGNLQE